MSPEFELCYEFFMKLDCLGSCMWSIQPRKTVVLFYLNNENIDIKLMKGWLTFGAEISGLTSADWKLYFKLICSKPEEWINDCYKKVEFVLKK